MAGGFPLRALVLAAIALTLLVPFGLADDARSYRYLAGSAFPPGLPARGGGFCVDSEGFGVADAPYPGGVCYIPAQGSFRIQVDDDVHGPVGFAYVMPDGGVTCPDGNAVGTVSIDAPPGCDEVSVILWLGATTGTIRVE